MEELLQIRRHKIDTAFRNARRILLPLCQSQRENISKSEKLTMNKFLKCSFLLMLSATCNEYSYPCMCWMRGEMMKEELECFGNMNMQCLQLRNIQNNIPEFFPLQRAVATLYITRLVVPPRCGMHGSWLRNASFARCDSSLVRCKALPFAAFWVRLNLEEPIFSSSSWAELWQHLVPRNPNALHSKWFDSIRHDCITLLTKVQTPNRTASLDKWQPVSVLLFSKTDWTTSAFIFLSCAHTQVWFRKLVKANKRHLR